MGLTDEEQFMFHYFSHEQAWDMWYEPVDCQNASRQSRYPQNRGSWMPQMDSWWSCSKNRFSFQSIER
jgi:hypothetical protein